jgi:lipopolysaccharide/colanic/teichoic acid biosynthesis glycosyltransferase
VSVPLDQAAAPGRDAAHLSAPPPGRARLPAGLRRVLKRQLDIALAGLALAAVAPLMLAIAAAIWRRDGAPVVYRHRRLGPGGRGFDCLKFRTMARDADRALAALLAASPAARAEWSATRKLRDDPRVLGAVGRFLRRTSLDELPQLVNVLRGERSLVGPRPIVADELAHYGAQAAWYFATRPGLTGPWQVGGRSDTGYATRVRLDVEYAQNPSLRRDLAILAGTVAAVLGSRGAC